MFAVPMNAEKGSSNEEYSTLVRKVEKRSSLSHREEL